MKNCLLLVALFLLTTDVWSASYEGFLVKIKNDRNTAELLTKKQNEVGYKIIRQLQVKGEQIFLVEQLPQQKKRTTDFINQMKAIPNVEVVEPNFEVSIITPQQGTSRSVTGKEVINAPNDPFFNKLWGLYNAGYMPAPAQHLRGVPGADVDALRAWSITKGDRKVKVAVIDTGIDYNHPDLKDNIWTNVAELNGQVGVDDDGNGFIDDIHGYDFANRDADPMDDNRHGTHCAGTIGAVHNNAQGVAGVMAEVSLIPVKFLAGSGSGSLDHAIESIDYATQLNVDVMSNSWGGGGYSQLLQEAIERSARAGIVFVAAAGNSSNNNDLTPSYPATYNVDNIISVAAHNIDDNLSGFSCFGKRTVHVAAPGQDIWSTVPGDQYASLSGTSMATPHVSGLVGLLIAKEGRKDFTELKNRLMYSSIASDAYRYKVKSRGRVNAYNFLTNKISSPPAVEPQNWTKIDLDLAFESDHPYLEAQDLSKTVSIPGAKYIRVIVEKFDLEPRYDNVFIKTKTGEIVDQVTGIGENHKTGYVEGDTVIMQFRSDFSINNWGFVIRSLEYSLD